MNYLVIGPPDERKDTGDQPGRGCFVRHRSGLGVGGSPTAI